MSMYLITSQHKNEPERCFAKTLHYASSPHSFIIKAIYGEGKKRLLWWGRICHVTNGKTYYLSSSACPVSAVVYTGKAPTLHRLRQRAILLYSELQNNQLSYTNSIYTEWILCQSTHLAVQWCQTLPLRQPHSTAPGKDPCRQIFSFLLWEVGSCTNIRFAVKFQKFLWF